MKRKADELSAEDVPISQELPNAQADTVDGNEQQFEENNDDHSGVDYSKLSGRQKKLFELRLKMVRIFILYLLVLVESFPRL